MIDRTWQWRALSLCALSTRSSTTWARRPALRRQRSGGPWSQDESHRLFRGQGIQQVACAESVGEPEIDSRCRTNRGRSRSSGQRASCGQLTTASQARCLPVGIAWGSLTTLDTGPASVLGDRAQRPAGHGPGTSASMLMWIFNRRQRSAASMPCRRFPISIRRWAFSSMVAGPLPMPLLNYVDSLNWVESRWQSQH